MKNLPFWHLTNKNASFYDCDSKTAVEMVAKLYGTVDELITEFNKFTEHIIELFNENKNSNEEFKQCITEMMENYIKVVENKLDEFEYNIESKFDEFIKSAIDNKQLVAEGNYNPETETLNIELVYKGNK